MKIKDKLRTFGILVIRMFWPGKGKSVHRLGLLMIIGLGAMIGVSQAGNIGKFVVASFAGETAENTPTKLVSGIPVLKASQTTAMAGDATEDARLSGAPNIVDLLTESHVIVRGMVRDLSDGFENGVPFTQVTVDVTESLRGEGGKEFTFRQFGLLEPRKMGSGKVNLNVTPAGWAKYTQSEEVILFVGHQAELTGLRTTVGLGQGKITFKGGNAESQFGNVGLFENVVADPKVVNDSDKRVLATRKGPVNKESFLTFLRKAVNNKWIEGGKLRHAKK